MYTLLSIDGPFESHQVTWHFYRSRFWRSPVPLARPDPLASGVNLMTSSSSGWDRNCAKSPLETKASARSRKSKNVTCAEGLRAAKP